MDELCGAICRYYYPGIVSERNPNPNPNPNLCRYYFPGVVSGTLPLTLTWRGERNTHGDTRDVSG